MKKVLVGKILVLVVCCLFAGASVIPTVTRNVGADGDSENVDYTILWQVDLPKVSYFTDYRADSGDTDNDGKD